MPMRIFLFTLILFTNNIVFGQHPIIDSVRSIFSSGNYSKVIQIVNQEIKNSTLSNNVVAELMITKAGAYEYLQDYDSSFYTFYDIYRRFPSNFYASLELGYRYGESGDFESAFYFFNNIRIYHPSEPSATINLAYFNNEAGNYKKSIAYSDTTLMLSTDSTTIGVAWNNRCYSNIMLGNIRIAKSDLDESLKFYPNNSYAYRNAGLILLTENKKNEACEAFERSKQLGGLLLTEELRKKHCGD